MTNFPTNKQETLSLRLWLQLMKCTKTIEAEVASQFRRSHHQSLTRFDLLSQLYRIGDDWVAIGELASKLMASGGNITGLLDRMVADDLIERRANPRDRRSFQVRTTKKGRDTFKEMTNNHAQWIEDALNEFSQKDKEQLIKLLVRVRRAFEHNTLI